MRRLPEREAKEWFEQHSKAFAAYGSGEIDVDTWWARRVEATWGLISRGVEAVPLAIEMLQCRNPDVREDGAGVLAEIGRDDEVIDRLLEALRTEHEDQPRDSMIQALGRLRNRRAIPYLAQIIRDPKTDEDTRWTAVGALGTVVRRRFDQQSDPVSAASLWLDSHKL